MASGDQSGGQIGRAIRTIRRLIDETPIQAKYKDESLIALMEEGWPEVLTDLYSVSMTPPLARYTVTPVVGQRYYGLPATVGEIRRIVARDTTTGRPTWEIIPHATLNPYGPGISFEGNQRCILEPTPQDASSTAFDVEYVPSGSVSLHVGRVPVTAINGSTGTDTFYLAGADPASQVMYGEIDRRPNAYLGSFLAVTDCEGGLKPTGYAKFPVQERIIQSYSLADLSVTIEPDFDFDFGDFPAQDKLLSYEIYPVEAPLVWPVLTRWVARYIAGAENRAARFRTLTQMYSEAKRACILSWANKQTRSGRDMNVVSVDNPEVWSLYG